MLSDLVKKAFGRSSRAVDGLLAFPAPCLYYRGRVLRAAAAYRPSGGFTRENVSRVPGIVLEVNNTCNLNCAMCRTLDSTRGQGEMPREMFASLVREKVSLGHRGLVMHTVGEPLMCSYFAEALKICSENGLRVRITTNGLLLDRQMAAITRYPQAIGHIAFSIDGATKETYEAIRRPARFEKLLENLELMFKYNKKASRKIPVSMQICLFKDNFGEIPLFRRTFGKYFRESDTLFSFMSNLSSEHQMGEYFGLHRLDIGSLYSRQTPCRLLWTQMHVLYDGSVSGCCRDYNGELIAGDVRKAPILEIWKSAEYSRLREKHLSGNLDDLPLCRDCYGVDKELTMIFNDYLLCLFSAFKDRQPDFYMERIYSFLRVLARLKEDGSGKGRRGIIKDLSKEMK